MQLSKSEQEKRNDKESMIFLTPKPSNCFFVYCIQSKEKVFLSKKSFLRKWGVEDWTKKKNEKKVFNCPR